MNDLQDKPLKLHRSFEELTVTFHNMIAAQLWLRASIDQAIHFAETDLHPFLVQLDCSVTNQQAVRVSKSILALLKKGRSTLILLKKLVKSAEFKLFFGLKTTCFDKSLPAFDLFSVEPILWSLAF